MKFDKKATLNNLKAFAEALEDIKEKRKWEWLMTDVDCELEEMKRNAEIKLVKSDIAYVRGLMDDIECDRITEMDVA